MMEGGEGGGGGGKREKQKVNRGTASLANLTAQNGHPEWVQIACRNKEGGGGDRETVARMTRWEDAAEFFFPLSGCKDSVSSFSATPPNRGELRSTSKE